MSDKTKSTSTATNTESATKTAAAETSKQNDKPKATEKYEPPELMKFERLEKLIVSGE